MGLSGNSCLYDLRRRLSPEEVATTRGVREMTAATGERWEELGGGIGVLVTREHGFGADALLLAAFARPCGRERVCDLGTGCGILPFLWLRDGVPSHVDAVDVEPRAVMLAERSCLRNGLTDRIRFLTADWDALPDSLPRGVFDRVSCNPPYFPPESGEVSRDAVVRRARHEPDGEMLERLCRSAAGLLKNGGKFCLCHRPERLCDVFFALRRAGLEPKVLRLVQARAGATPRLFLCEARKGGKPGLRILPPLLSE